MFINLKTQIKFLTIIFTAKFKKRQISQENLKLRNALFYDSIEKILILWIFPSLSFSESKQSSFWI